MVLPVEVHRIDWARGKSLALLPAVEYRTRVARNRVADIDLGY